MRAARNLEGIPGVDPADVLDEFVDVAVKMEARVAEAEARADRYKRDGGGSDDEADDDGAATGPNGNVNNPHTLEGVEVARLEAKVASLEGRAKALEDDLVKEKVGGAARLSDAAQILKEAKEAGRRQRAALERRLAAATAEGETARSEIELMRLERNKVRLRDATLVLLIPPPFLTPPLAALVRRSMSTSAASTSSSRA